MRNMNTMISLILFAILCCFIILRLCCFFLSSISSSSSSSSQKENLPHKYRYKYTYGPPSYPIIGCLISFYQNRRRLLDWYTQLLSRSPTQTILVHRFGAPRTLVTANPSNVEHILKTNFHNYPKGKPFTDILGDFLGIGIFNVDGDLWNSQRKLASHEFTAKSLRDFVVKVLEDEFHHRLLPLLQNALLNNTVLDLQDVLKRFTFDTICKVSLGVDPFCLHHLDHHHHLRPPPVNVLPPLARAFDTASEICAMRGAAPVFAIWKSKRALNLGSEKMLKQAINLIHECVSDIIQTKRQKLHDAAEAKDDLLSKLLMAGHDDEVVRDMVISFVMAGRDTTSAAMTWLFWLLTRYPDVENQAVREVVSLMCESDPGKPLGFEHLKEMNYMKACLCESMRLYPPVAWDSKHAKEDDILPDGTPVFKGDRVTYFPYGMGRMEKLWGRDRFEFRPERWFDDASAAAGGLLMRNVSPYKFPIFQAGPRVCLGKEMAFIQMKYVMASVLRHFKIEAMDSNVQPLFVPLLTAHMAGGFNVRVRLRDGF